mmetsp:Transcript_465/g.919  ORF Transcript_465/g.919 Transcript_465/m.919 type:complete len:210 (-) Transcript_465:3-632(-)
MTASSWTAAMYTTNRAAALKASAVDVKFGTLSENTVALCTRTLALRRWSSASSLSLSPPLASFGSVESLGTSHCRRISAESDSCETQLCVANCLQSLAAAEPKNKSLYRSSMLFATSGKADKLVSLRTCSTLPDVSNDTCLSSSSIVGAATVPPLRQPSDVSRLPAVVSKSGSLCPSLTEGVAISPRLVSALLTGKVKHASNQQHILVR